MGGFRSGRYDVLVATDIASRGIDVSGVSHVINFDVPNTPEAYTHRIGRTGRAELEGVACTFVTGGDRLWVRDTERMIGAPIPRRQVEGLEAVDDSRSGRRRPAQVEAVPGSRGQRRRRWRGSSGNGRRRRRAA